MALHGGLGPPTAIVNNGNASDLSPGQSDGRIPSAEVPALVTVPVLRKATTTKAALTRQSI